MPAPTPLRAGRWLLDGTLVALVGIVVAALMLSRVLPALDHQTVTITGRSMEPAIPLGSVVVLDRVAPDVVAVGDIITVTVPERRITYTHRIVAIVDRSDGRWLRTKGDANDASDPVLVPATWVVGRLDVALPAFGWLLRLLTLPAGVLTILGLALTLFLAARLIEELEWEADGDDRRQARRIPSSSPAPVTSTTMRRRRAAASAEARAAIRDRSAARGSAPNRAARS